MDSLEEIHEEEIQEGNDPRPQHKGPHWNKPPRPPVLHRREHHQPDFSYSLFGSVEDKELDEYSIFSGDQSNLVLLSSLPLEFAGQELIASGGSARTLEASVHGKSGEFSVVLTITAWKLEFPKTEPFHILVAVKQTNDVKRWVKLKEPHSGYKNKVENIFCMAEFFTFLRLDPRERPEGDYFSEAFCDYLRNHCSLIEQYIDLDPVLKETDARQILRSNLKKRLRRPINSSSDEDKSRRSGKNNMNLTAAKDESEGIYLIDGKWVSGEGGEFDEDDKFRLQEDFCVLCDEGGEVLCCDGPCLRSFHARPKDGEASSCTTLGYRDETNLEDIAENWLCKNCEIKKHQCFMCGKLGDSDVALGPSRQVFLCDVAACGKFYHPECVASEVDPDGERESIVNGIRAGESFTCPLHKCRECGKGEEIEDVEFSLAGCRRCPAAWHVKCLPTPLRIYHDTKPDGFEPRCWKLAGRFILYCTEHEILSDLRTPLRNHIQFPKSPNENIRIKEEIPEATNLDERPEKRDSIIGTEQTSFRAEASSSALSLALGTARPATRHDDDIKRLCHTIVELSKQSITEESLERKGFLLRLGGCPEWMNDNRIDSILKAAKIAKVAAQQNRMTTAMMYCPPRSVFAIIEEEGRMEGFLAPTFDADHYTSFGRYFTKGEILRKVVEALHPYIQNGDMIVDFCCGDNYFTPYLREKLLKARKFQCRSKSFDIFIPKYSDHSFQRKDWFTVTRHDCGPGDKLVIGLHPPVLLAKEFIGHALQMNPRILVLIIPERFRKFIPEHDYDCCMDDRTTLANHPFFLPGILTEDGKLVLQRNLIDRPHLYIFQRKTTQQRRYRYELMKSGKIVPTYPSDHVSRDSGLVPELQIRDQKPETLPPPSPGPGPSSQPSTSYTSRGRPVDTSLMQHHSMMSGTMGATLQRRQDTPGQTMPRPTPGAAVPFEPRADKRRILSPPRPQNQQFRHSASTSTERPVDSDLMDGVSGLVSLKSEVIGAGLQRDHDASPTPESVDPFEPNTDRGRIEISGPSRPQDQEFHHAASISRERPDDPQLRYRDSRMSGALDAGLQRDQESLPTSRAAVPFEPGMDRRRIEIAGRPPRPPNQQLNLAAERSRERPVDSRRRHHDFQARHDHGR